MSIQENKGEIDRNGGINIETILEQRGQEDLDSRSIDLGLLKGVAALDQMRDCLEVVERHSTYGPVLALSWPIGNFNPSHSLLIDLADSRGERQFLENVVDQLINMMRNPKARYRIDSFLEWVSNAS